MRMSGALRAVALVEAAKGSLGSLTLNIAVVAFMLYSVRHPGSEGIGEEK